MQGTALMDRMRGLELNSELLYRAASMMVVLASTKVLVDDAFGIAIAVAGMLFAFSTKESGDDSIFRWPRLPELLLLSNTWDEIRKVDLILFTDG